MTTSLGYLAVKDQLVPGEVKTQGANEGPTYTAPSTWDGMLAVTRDQFLAWDQLAWQVEQSGGTAALTAAVGSIMQTQGADQLKTNLTTFVKSSGRVGLLNALLQGLHPTLSNALTRRSIIDAVYRLNQDGLLDPIPAYLGNGLSTYTGSGLETDGINLVHLTRINAIFQNQ